MSVCRFNIFNGLRWKEVKYVRKSQRSIFYFSWKFFEKEHGSFTFNFGSYDCCSWKKKQTFESSTHEIAFCDPFLLFFENICVPALAISPFIWFQFLIYHKLMLFFQLLFPGRSWGGCHLCEKQRGLVRAHRFVCKWHCYRQRVEMHHSCHTKLANHSIWWQQLACCNDSRWKQWRCKSERNSVRR